MLELRSVSSGYNGREVLSHLSLTAEAAKTLAIIGINGAGKSTLLKTVAGVIGVSSGAIVFRGSDMTRSNLHHRLQSGVVYMPQGMRVFDRLTVAENLTIGVRQALSARQAIQKACTQFPVLQSRLSQRAGLLSGGERQLVAFANAMLQQPRLLLLDEPSFGISPAYMDHVFQCIRALSASGVTILLAEQNVREALEVADKVVVLKSGAVSFAGVPADIRSVEKLKRVLL